MRTPWARLLGAGGLTTDNGAKQETQDDQGQAPQAANCLHRNESGVPTNIVTPGFKINVPGANM